jgi:hypothetical protein
MGNALEKTIVVPPHIIQATASIKDFGLKPYVRLSKVLPHSENKTWKLVCEMPYNAQFQPWIKLTGSAGQTLIFNSSNPLVQYLTPAEKTTTQDGTHTYEAKNWISGEGAVYTIPAGVTVNEVRYRETGYDTKITGSFECNDPDYNILWKRAARTAYLCMRDHFYDCPDRERVGFWGDGTPELDTCFYVFDERSHQLAKNLVLRPLEPDFYPGQIMEFLGEYGIWFYYMQTGDQDSVKTVYPSTKQFLFHTYRFGDAHTWYDWGKDSKDTAIIETCFYKIDLESLKKMALATGHTEDIPEIKSKISDIQATFDQKYWKGGFYQSNDVTSPDDRANAMAINAGLASQNKWPLIFKNVLENTTNSSCFFDRWVFEALQKIGKQDFALMRMAHRYRTMIQSRFTSLWEHYDRWWASWINAFDEGSSLNHGWNPPALLLSRDVAGIKPTKPGWANFEVLPQEGFLRECKVSVPTVKGNIKMTLIKRPNRMLLNVVVPDATSGTIGIPITDLISAQRVRITCDAASKPRSSRAQIPGYIAFKVGPGRWTLEVRGRVKTKSPKANVKTEKLGHLLEKREWTAQASVPDSTFLFSGGKIPIDVSAENALDGDAWTGWRDMTRTQYPGQWFQVDMQQVQSFDRVVLDNTWALYDSPKRYQVTVSTDGTHWSRPVADGVGQLGITKIKFPTQKARFFRITQLGSNPTYHWSIYELDVYKS